jgi:toxin-antitoxin system PIN domain toxin
MNVFLLDVNVLVALFDPAHVNHEAAHQWFGNFGQKGWATCPITENGLVRVLSNPAYLTVVATPAEVIDRLRTFCKRPGHVFWEESISIRDPAIFQTDRIAGHQKLTDLYLAGLALRHRGKLATFDQHIPLHALTPPAHGLVELISI